MSFYVTAISQLSSNRYGLNIINDINDLESTILIDSNKSFVKLNKFIPDIVLDIKYATTQNIFYEQLYPFASALLRLPAAIALKQVQADLKKQGIGLKIYDAYRPYSVTCRMFERLPDTIFMGLPWKGSKHNRGIAVDLTLIDIRTGNELPMPTPFDALVYASHPQYIQLSDEVKRNRDLLINAMSKYGFKVDPVEWWHFNYLNSIEFELLDIPHSSIEYLIEKYSLKKY
jgi:D-alanyl-D-alanine dipeptidase